MNSFVSARRLLVAALVVLVLVVIWRFTLQSVPMDELDQVLRAEPFERADVVRLVTRSCRPERRPELVRRLAQLENGDDLALAVLTETMEIDPNNADQVLETYRAQFPAKRLLPTWAFTLRIKQGRFDEAARIYREEAAKLMGNDTARQSLQYQFLTRMAAAGRPVEAYEEVDSWEAEYALCLLGSMLEDRCDRKEKAAVEALRKLVAEYAQKGKPTPWTAYYLGRADEGEGKYEDAQRHYAEALKKVKAAGHVPEAQRAHRSKADKDWDRIRHRRAYCLWKLGRWEQAYDECEPAKDTFRWLSQVFEAPERVDELQRLVDRHQARHPGDETLPYWQGVVHWHRKEYAKAIPCFEEHLRKAKLPYLFELRATDRKFRSLIRLDRLDEARAMLRPPDKRRWPDELHWAMVLAAKTGDVGTLERILGDYQKVRTDYPAQAYADEDLGPLLRSDAFTKLREKYPPPARKQGKD